MSREISRDQTRRMFSMDSDSMLSNEHELLIDIEDRILGMIEELNDSGLGLGQRCLNESLIELALSEMKQIRSASDPWFQKRSKSLTL